MRIAAYVCYAAAAVIVAVAVVAAFGFAREYGWELRAALGWAPVLLVAVGIPVWVGSLFQRRARDRERIRPLV